MTAIGTTSTIHAGRDLAVLARRQWKEPLLAETIIIPASVQLDLREALLSSVEDALQEMDGGLVLPEREYHPEWFAPARRRLDYLWPLVDFLGWNRAEVAVDKEIPLARSALVLIRECIEEHLIHYETWLEEADINDASREERGLPPKKEETVRRARDLEGFLASLPA
jgi:hypothetical protein